MTKDSPSSKATSAHVINSMFNSAPSLTLEEKIEAAKAELKRWHTSFCKTPNNPIVKNQLIKLNIDFADLWIEKKGPKLEDLKLEDLELVEKYLSAAETVTRLALAGPDGKPLPKAASELVGMLAQGALK